MALTVDSILKLPKSKKILILIGMLGAVTALYFHSFFGPRQQELTVLKDDLNRLVKELDESKAVTQLAAGFAARRAFRTFSRIWAPTPAEREPGRQLLNYLSNHATSASLDSPIRASDQLRGHRDLRQETQVPWRLSRHLVDRRSADFHCRVSRFARARSDP